MGSRVVPAVLATALVTVLVTVPVAASAADVPVPRLSPMSGVVEASLVSAAPISMGPRLSLAAAIERELTVDVSLSVATLYAERDFEPVWTESRAAALRARLAEAAGDGLDPADYFVPAAGDDVFSRALEDVSLTEAALRYARHAHSGRIAPRSISRIVDQDPPRLDEGRFLNRLAIAGDVAGTLESVHPVHPQYHALRRALREALARQGVKPVVVGAGPFLKVGSEGPRVAALRSRIDATVMRGRNPEIFDEALAEAVRAFQRANGLVADGIVGPRTLAVLDAAAEANDVEAIASNLERWRWMPRHLGRNHVFVNIPAYRVEVRSSGETTFSGRVVVGRPANPTPVFSDEIEHVVVNPYWNVPYSIASTQMLGALRSNPAGYAARRNLEVVSGGRVVAASSVAWSAETLRRVRVRQRPGRGNALGAVKFLFPNEWAVYLHDTPERHLFRRDRRAYSHGCVRVESPFDFAEALLAHDGRISGRGARRMVGGGEKWMNTSRHIPVHLAYFTREVDAEGRLVRLEDIYGFDRRTRRALGLSS